MADFNVEDMDKAAKDAEKDLTETLSGESVTGVAEWFAKWYLKAGHKRLGRLLVTIAKDPDKYSFQ